MEQHILLSIPLPGFVSMIEETIRKVLTEKNIEQDKLLTSEEVMKLLNISTTTLQLWRNNKKIPYTRMGNKIFYSKSQIMSSLKIGTTNTE